MPALSEPFSTEAVSPAAERMAIPESLQEGWSSPSEWKINLARLAYRYRAVPWVLFWTSAAGAAAMAACTWFGLPDRFCPVVLPGPWWWTGFAGWMGLWLISSAFIVAISGWFGVRFRYVAWGAATLCGAAARALRAYWRVLLLVLFPVVLVQVDVKLADMSDFLKSDWNLLPAVLVALAMIFLLSLLWGAFRGRRRIVVQEIKNHTVRKELEACAQGLSDRLCGELAGLAQLYSLINRSQGSRRKNVFDPAIDIQDSGELLESTVSAQATLDLKLFKVPIGAVLGLGSRLLRGARLAGSLHEYDGSLLLVAQMTGGGQEGETTWRVSAADLDEEDRKLSPPLVLDRMIRQLACRIAADQVSVGSRKWRAVHHFTEGLRAYRSSQGTMTGKLLRLHQAEQSFLKALSEDEGFAQCHYNLGIVYGEMEGKDDAADAAFRRALRGDAEPSEACYALAVGYFGKNRFADALWFSRHAIRIQPDEPRAWHLCAMSLYYGRVKPETKQGRPGPPNAWEESLEAEALAVGIAWRDFCRWRMKGRLADPAEAGLPLSGDHRETAAAFTCSLANGFLLRDFSRRLKERKEGPVAGEGRKLAERDSSLEGRKTSGQRRAWALIRQSARLAPDDSANYFLWAEVLWKTGDVVGTARMLDRVFGGRLEEDQKIDFWSYLLAVHAGLMILQPGQIEHHDNARDACDYLLDAVAARDPGPVEVLVKPLEEARDRLEQALAWATASSEEGAGAQTSRLEHLLKELTWRPGETPVRSIQRLPLLPSDSTAESVFYLWRLSSLLTFIKKFQGALEIRPSEEEGWPPEPWRTEVWEPYLHAHLEALDRAGLIPSDGEKPSFGPFYLFQVQRRDWEWACSQTAVRHGLGHLEEKHPQAEPAHRCLADALASIDKRTHCHQIVDQCLRSRLAEACLLEAQVAWNNGDLERWTKLLRQGVTEAEKAVGLEPAGYEEHKVLGRLYFELGDYQRAEEEWKVCFVVKPDPEILNLMAEAVWRQGLELSTAQARRQAFTGAVKMFEEARELIEKNPSSSPEDHGKSHFWLGVFHRELLEFDQAIFNHKIAWSLGVRPLEAQTSLAWAYLEARMYGEALATFQAAAKEAHLQLARRTQTEKPGFAEPGQEMPLDEIMLRIQLGRALHHAELGVRLGRAEHLIRDALRHARRARSYKRAELRARCFECRGLIHLRRYELEKASSAELDAAIQHLQKALQLHARCDTYLLLARAHLHRAKAAQGSPRKEDLETARQDCERARGADLRGRRDWEIKDLLRQIEEEGKGSPSATAELRRIESGGRSKPAEAA